MKKKSETKEIQKYYKHVIWFVNCIFRRGFYHGLSLISVPASVQHYTYPHKTFTFRFVSASC